MAPTTPFPQKVATELRAEMGAQMKTIAHLADALGLDRKAAKRRYDGEKSLTLAEVDTLAAWLEVDIDRLLVGRLAVAS